MTGRGKLVVGAGALLALGGCMDIGGLPGGGGSAATPPAPLGVFGTGYPNAGDACRRAGETSFTNQFLDDASDLVACPPGTDLGLFAFTFSARQMAQLDGWTLFSVPRR
ncbi:MAG: hypothetical protein ACXIUV_05890 [Alkalilacustris sp.]